MEEIKPEDAIWEKKTYAVNRVLKYPVSKIKKELIKFPSYLSDSLVSTEYIGDTRYYNVNGRKYPSITSVIKLTDKEGDEALKKWRGEIGTEKADKITQSSSYAGSKWHKLAEMFLLGEKLNWTFFHEPDNFFKATNIALALSENVSKIYAVETSIYSDFYQIAGRMDLCVELIDGRNAILDFKTGFREKKKNRIVKAAVQCCFYGHALTEQIPSCIIDTVAVIQVLPKQILFQTSPIDFWKPYLKKVIVDYAKRVNG